MNLVSYFGRYARYGVAAARTKASSLNSKPWSRAWYVVEPRDWSIRWDGRFLSDHVKNSGVRMETTLIPSGARSQVVHYGSRSLFLLGQKLRCDPSNRVVFTWFHGSEQDLSAANQRMFELLPRESERADLVVTSSRIAAGRLSANGVDGDKIRVIPLGVDCDSFTPANAEARFAMRERLGIPHDALCIGSFHKDGEGWGEGDRPKYEKAPEILVDAVSELARQLAPGLVHVLLTGPARGFVKMGLDRAGVRYTHTNVPDFRLLPPVYHALDTYLIPSRDEGGPKGLLEAAASGVPVVSTRVGMSADLIDHGRNGALAEVDDVAGLVAAMRWLREDRTARERISTNGRLLAERHRWSVIGSRYAQEIYLPLLEAGRSGRPVAANTGGDRRQNLAA
jgi:glycosyltransferase involved in cell wall biosynthesis